MNVLNFITNNWDAIVTRGGLVGRLVWHRGKQTKLSDLWDTLLKLGHQALPALLSDPRLFDDPYVRERIKDAKWRGLELLGAKKTPTITKLVDEAAEHIKGELAEHLWKMQMG